MRAPDVFDGSAAAEPAPVRSAAAAGGGPPRFACPGCRGSLAAPGADGFACTRCGARFDQRGGIYRFLDASRAGAAAALLRQHQRCRPLPPAGRDDAAALRLRRESYAHLERHALPAVWRGPAHILDLGAGNGWLSNRLASFGHRAVAVDQLDDDTDGLGACRLYPAQLITVQADFDELPFEGGQFDLAIFSQSLHEAPDPHATLAEAKRMLAPGGAIVVMNSPVFEDERDGQAMVAEQTLRLQREHGPPAVVHTGPGFLTFKALERTTISLGLSGRFVRSHGPPLQRLQRQLARLRRHSAPAAFGLWVAR